MVSPDHLTREMGSLQLAKIKKKKLLAYEELV